MLELTFLKELILIIIKRVGQKSDIFYYCYFLYYSFMFQPNVCNRCQDLLMMSMNLSDIAILNIKGSGFSCIIILISKNEAIHLMQNADLTGKK